jgi:hypothetical protein
MGFLIQGQHRRWLKSVIPFEVASDIVIDNAARNAVSSAIRH